MHHYKDDHLRIYLDENKFDVVIFVHYRILSISKNEISISKQLTTQNKDHFL